MSAQDVNEDIFGQRLCDDLGGAVRNALCGHSHAVECGNGDAEEYGQQQGLRRAGTDGGPILQLCGEDERKALTAAREALGGIHHMLERMHLRIAGFVALGRPARARQRAQRRARAIPR